jgi:hypothetical protein
MVGRCRRGLRFVVAVVTAAGALVVGGAGDAGAIGCKVGDGGYRLYSNGGGAVGFRPDGTSCTFGSLGGGPLVSEAVAPNGVQWVLRFDGVADSDRFGRRIRLITDVPISAPASGIATTADGKGAWIGSEDGAIFAYGNAHYLGAVNNLRVGNTGLLQLAAPIVDLAQAPVGEGYWQVGADGGVFAWGSAKFHGSLTSTTLAAPIVDLVPTPTGKGYWLGAADGGVFTFGDARFFGSAAALHLDAPILGMAATATGRGYWLAASDGGVFAFGDARFLGRGGVPHLSPGSVWFGITS